MPRFRRFGLVASIAATLVVLLAAVGAPPVAAHAFLVRSDPQPGARLERSPERIRLFYSEPLVAGSQKVSITAGGQTPTLSQPTARGAVVTQRLPPRAKGVAIVSWRGVSDDGHLTAGEFAFGVGAAAAGAVSAERATSAPIGWGQAAIQWLFFVGLALALGGLVSEIVAWGANRRTRSDPPVAAPVRPGIALASLAAVLYLILLAGQGTGGGLLDGFDGGALRDALSSRPGLLTVAALGALVGAQLLVAARRRPAAAAALAVAVVVVAARGHAGTSGYAWAVGADALHLATAAVWVGALAHIVLLLARRCDDSLRARLIASVQRYSRLALPAVVLLLVSGVVNALAEFREPGELVDTSYGRTLLVKAGVVALALNAALLAREIALPTAVRTLRTGLLRRLTRAELTGLAGALAAAAVLSSAAPPRSSADAALAGTPRLGPPPLSGPVLRLADLAGNVVVGLDTNGRELRFTVLPPMLDKTTGVKLRLEVERPGQRPADLYPRRCGKTCFTIRFPLPRGTTKVTAFVAARGWAGGGAHFRIAWPPGRSAARRLREVRQTMRGVGPLTLTEAVTSGPGSRNNDAKTSRVTGRELLGSGEVYGRGAVDVRVLSRRRGRTELAFALPGSNIWYRMTVDRHDRIVAERVVSPGHLIRRSFRYPDEAGRDGRPSR